MTPVREPLVWLALVCTATVAAAVLAMHADAVPLSYAVAGAAVCAGIVLAWRIGSLGGTGGSTAKRRAGEPNQALQKLADEGRKLAIYDRATGLYAYWYLQMRAEEEMSRAGRYQKPLSVASFWCATRDAIERATATLAGTLRSTDLAAYLGNGHFVVLLPETSAEGATIVVERVRERVGEGVTGVAVQYPEDGETLNDLIETANVIDRVLARAKERESDAA
jgi:GGDEF domain-containing protein